MGNGLVARCVATGLAFQTRHGGNDAVNCGVSPAPSAGRRYGNTNVANNNNNSTSGNMGAIDIALVGPADLHALPLPESYELESPSSRHGAAAVPSSVSFQGQVWKKSQSVSAVSRPESASTVPPPPASWGNHGARPSDGGAGSPVLGGGGGRGRSRLAFFPANDDGGSSRSPSPAGPVGAGFGGARGYGFLSNSPPPVGGERDSRRWWSGSESPSPRHRQQPQQQQQRQWQRSMSPLRARRRGVGLPEEEEEDEGVVFHVACLPVTGGDGGQAMMGVLKVKPRCRQGVGSCNGGHVFVEAACVYSEGRCAVF